MQRSTVALLACPACHGRLAVSGGSGDLLEGELLEGELLEGELSCSACGAAYPVTRGVPAFVREAPDEWRDASAILDAALAQDQSTRTRLLDAPLATLNGADLVFRGMVMEARGDLDGATAAFAASEEKLATDAARACQARLVDECVKRTAGASFVVDVASGRGRLVEQLARAGRRVLATDISPVAMIRLRARLVALGLGQLVDCLACDAAALPFADRAVPVATSFVGLQNIPDPSRGLAELRRVAVTLLAVGQAYPVDDVSNGEALREHGYGHVADRATLDDLLAGAGWQPDYPLVCAAETVPTPPGEIIEGVGIDAFPVAPTTLEWHLLEAS